MKPYLPSSGYLFSFHLLKIPIYIHWTFPIGGIFFAFFFSVKDPIGILSLVTAYVALIIIHELGHALAALFVSSRIYSVLVTGVGGWCFADEPEKNSSKLLFYAGGLIAQILLFGMTILWVTIFGNPESNAGNYFILVFTFVNVLMFIINLIPSGGSDGDKMYQLLKQKLYKI